jgi:hypothetical protein
MQVISTSQLPIPQRCDQHKPGQPQTGKQARFGGQLVVFGAATLRLYPVVSLWLGMVHLAILPGAPLMDSRNKATEGNLNFDEAGSMAEVIALLQP